MKDPSFITLAPTPSNILRLRHRPAAFFRIPL
jgi:hypothetical protein